MELKFTKLEFHVAFFQYKNPHQHKFLFYFILFFYNETRVFKTWFTQQTWVSWTRVSKKWYITTYFANSDMLLIIYAKSAKWPISPINNINPAATIIGNDVNTNATLCSELIWAQMAFKKDCGLKRHFMYMYFCQIKWNKNLSLSQFSRWIIYFWPKCKTNYLSFIFCQFSHLSFSFVILII